jgi:hypothetical protein
MDGRRRFARYLLLSTAKGRARTVSDCVVESWDGESAVVATAQPARPDDNVTLQFNTPAGAARSRQARVLSCEMDTRHGPLRFRLHLQVTADPNQPDTILDFPAGLRPGPVNG